MLNKRESLYPEFKSILRCDGKDGENGYFNDESAIHCFLVVSPIANIMDGKSTLAEILVHSQDLYLVDPSFGIVQPFPDSGYTIDTIYNEGATILNDDKNLTLEPNDFVPLVVDKNKKLWFLYNAGLEMGLCITKGKIEPNDFDTKNGYTLRGDHIDKVFQNDKLMTHMVNVLRRKVESQDLVK
jgi:hypothetical protein